MVRPLVMVLYLNTPSLLTTSDCVILEHSLITQSKVKISILSESTFEV